MPAASVSGSATSLALSAILALPILTCAPGASPSRANRIGSAIAP
jgi:hypothetical protein